ncbi:tRNA-queuosine alpha-mannosyltransferase domain-containing protein [Neptuniibacter halophilus]|uniref:tRNA-queuosine alpha-mannosyltransferase domain-containing protein n=1 Tax=Neptuniibacter halophilus TaxID=651666 RepID=UPI0025726CC0|nr:DUF3524 domain-containing protein [Neptuniibacter halophilus]
MRILLLSAYDAESHLYWRKGLVEHLPEHDWTVLSLPGRYFSWRIRGNSLSWAFSERDTLQQDYDLVIATSMTDLSALRGFVPSMAQIPTLVYFHENQFAYPSSGREFQSVEPCILNLYTALAADHCLFNSEYNRRTLLKGAKKLLKKLPDQVPSGLVERIAANSSVLPVPLRDDSFQPALPEAGRFHIVWNHRWESVTDGHTVRPICITWAARWEYDKGPDRLLAILRRLESNAVDYRLCLLGQSFKHSPKEFQMIKEEFAHRIDHAGYAASRDEYKAWLAASDIFLSTSIHEFQGLAVLEAVAQGCIPVLPDRMSYTEMFSSEYLYADCGADIEYESVAAVDAICHHKGLIEQGRHKVPDVSGYSWGVMADRYRHLIDTMVAK